MFHLKLLIAKIFVSIITYLQTKVGRIGGQSRLFNNAWCRYYHDKKNTLFWPNPAKPKDLIDRQCYKLITENLLSTQNNCEVWRDSFFRVKNLPWTCLQTSSNFQLSRCTAERNNWQTQIIGQWTKGKKNCDEIRILQKLFRLQKVWRDKKIHRSISLQKWRVLLLV